MKLMLLTLAVCATCLADGSSCDTKDVSGTYAFLANGSVLVPGAPISGPFMRIGYFTADGRGAIRFSTLALYNGINFGTESFTGTYSLTSDCTIDLHVEVPQPINANAHFKGQVALGGDDAAFMLIDTNDPTKPGISTVAGFGRIRDVQSCSDETLAGAWRMEINGTRNLPPLGTGTLYRQVGRFQIDGRGGLLASFVTSNNGAISNEIGAGTYSMSSDCTFDLNYAIGNTPYSIRGSMIDRDEAFLGLNLPGVNQPGVGILTGAVATGTLLRQSGKSQ
jgi:hypothetical protein